MDVDIQRSLFSLPGRNYGQTTRPSSQYPKESRGLPHGGTATVNCSISVDGCSRL